MLFANPAQLSVAVALGVVAVQRQLNEETPGPAPQGQAQPAEGVTGRSGAAG